MSDIPNFEPNWSLDDEEVIGKNADEFKTIEETIARIKLLKMITLANLHEKGVAVKDPDKKSLYEIISAIKDIPLNTGVAKIIRPFKDTIYHSMIKTSWDFIDLGGSVPYDFLGAHIKHAKVKDIEDIYQPHIWYKWTNNFNQTELTPLNITLDNTGGETSVAILAYLVTAEQLGQQIQPYTINFSGLSTPVRMVFGTNGIQDASTGLYSKIDIWYLQDSPPNCNIVVEGSFLDTFISLDAFAVEGLKEKPSNKNIYAISAAATSYQVTKSENELVFHILISDLNLKAEQTYLLPDEIKNMALNFNGDEFKSKISLNYDKGEILTKYIQCENRVHLYVPIYFQYKEEKE